jgi:hypothetical protein
MKRNLLLLLIITLAVGACRKDIITPPDGDPILLSLDEMLRQIPIKRQTDTTFVLRKITTDQELTTRNNMKIFLRQTERLFTETENRSVIVPCSQCNELKITVSEVYKTGDIIGRKVPTATSANFLLETGAMVNIQATCDGRSLALADKQFMQLLIPSTNRINDLMIHHYEPNAKPQSGWNGTGGNPSWTSWNPIPNLGEKVTGYSLLVSKIDWIAAAQRIGENNNTSIRVQVGNDNVINKNNTRVFVTFTDKGRRINGIAQFNVKEGDAPNMFTFDGAPIGMNARIYVISKIGEQFLWKEHDVRQLVQRDMSIVPIAPDKYGPLQLLEALRAL